MDWKQKRFSYVPWVLFLFAVAFGTGRCLYEMSGGSWGFGNGISGKTIGLLLLEGVAAVVICLLVSKIAARVNMNPLYVRILEVVFILVFFGIGTWLRFDLLSKSTLVIAKGSVVSYADAAMIRAGSMAPYNGHVAEYLYICVLREISYLFGNHANFLIRFQVGLNLLVGLVWMIGVRRLAGKAAGVCFAGFYFLSGTVIRQAITLSPESLFLLAYGIGLILLASFLKKSDRSLLVSLIAGLWIGITIALDLLGATLLIFAFSIWHVERREKENKKKKNSSISEDMEEISAEGEDTKKAQNVGETFDEAAKSAEEKNADGSAENVAAENAEKAEPEEKTEVVLSDEVKEAGNAGTIAEKTAENAAATVSETASESIAEDISAVKENEAQENEKERTSSETEGQTVKVSLEKATSKEMVISLENANTETEESGAEAPLKKAKRERKEKTSAKPKNEQKQDKFYGRFVSFVCLFAGAAIGFISFFAAYTGIRGLNLADSIENWAYLYCSTNEYQFSFYKDIFSPVGYTEINFGLMILLGLGTFSFFFKGKKERTSPWICVLVLMMPLMFCGNLSYAVPGYGLFYLVILALAGVSFYNAFVPNPEMVEHEKNLLAERATNEENAEGKKNESENAEVKPARSKNPIVALIEERKRKKEEQQREINKILYALSSMSEDAIIANSVEKEREKEAETKEDKKKRKGFRKASKEEQYEFAASILNESAKPEEDKKDENASENPDEKTAEEVKMQAESELQTGKEAELQANATDALDVAETAVPEAIITEEKATEKFVEERTREEKTADVKTAEEKTTEVKAPEEMASEEMASEEKASEEKASEVKAAEVKSTEANVVNETKRYMVTESETQDDATKILNAAETAEPEMTIAEVTAPETAMPESTEIKAPETATEEAEAKSTPEKEAEVTESVPTITKETPEVTSKDVPMDEVIEIHEARWEDYLPAKYLDEEDLKPSQEKPTYTVNDAVSAENVQIADEEPVSFREEHADAEPVPVNILSTETEKTSGSEQISAEVPVYTEESFEDKADAGNTGISGEPDTKDTERKQSSNDAELTQDTDNTEERNAENAEKKQDIRETAQAKDVKDAGQRTEDPVLESSSGRKDDEDYDERSDEPPKPRMLENPLPLPKRHEGGPMDYDYEVSDDDDYDYD